MMGLDGSLFIVDLKRSWLGLFEKEMKSALTPQEAKTLFAQSQLRAGRFFLTVYGRTTRERAHPGPVLPGFQ